MQQKKTIRPGLLLPWVRSVAPARCPRRRASSPFWWPSSSPARGPRPRSPSLLPPGRRPCPRLPISVLVAARSPSSSPPVAVLAAPGRPSPSSPSPFSSKSNGRFQQKFCGCHRLKQKNPPVPAKNEATSSRKMQCGYSKNVSPSSSPVVARREGSQQSESLVVANDAAGSSKNDIVAGFNILVEAFSISCRSFFICGMKLFHLRDEAFF